MFFKRYQILEWKTNENFNFPCYQILESNFDALLDSRLYYYVYGFAHIYDDAISDLVSETRQSMYRSGCNLALYPNWVLSITLCGGRVQVPTFKNRWGPNMSMEVMEHES